MSTVSTILKIFQFRKKKTFPLSSSFQILSTFENQTKIVAVSLKRRAEDLKNTLYIGQ